jgi:hypothetical protein
MRAVRPLDHLLSPLLAVMILAGGAEVARAQGDSKAPAPDPAPAAPPTSGPSREKVLKLGYDAYVGGLNIFAFTIDFALGGESYSILGKGESRGIARLFWRWSTRLAAGGNLDAEGVRPQLYNVDTFSTRRNLSMQLSFDENGKYTIRRTPPDTAHRAAKRKLPATVPETSIDPLSLSFRIARSVADGRGCNGTHFIFDGNRRYDLMFSDLGVSKLPYTPYSVFSGDARRCQFDMKRISGFREPREFIRFWDEDNLDPPRIWLARVVPEMPPVPVRLEGDLNMGGIRIYLVWAEFAGKPVFSNGVKPDVRVARSP